ncbi:MAG TPA: cytochrome c-type biogenesis protein CcmH [Nitrospirae bacterium]|nr:cytochrome c-type biogenesis protein CcmH [Nitrospirota bacterium]
MVRFIKYGGLIIFSFMLILSVPSKGFSLSTTEVESNLICDCGCGQLLGTCECERAEEMRTKISGMIDKGKTKEEILNSFVSQYGERILSAPPKKGFNLIAYILPFVGLLAGLIVAVIFVRKWAFSGRKDAAAESETKGSELNDEMQKKIDDELKKLEED